MVLAPVPPIEDWLAELDALKERAPGLFNVRALVLDVTGLAFERSDLSGLIASLSERNITVLGIEGIGQTWLGPGFPPPLSGGRDASDIAVPEPSAVSTPKPAEPLDLSPGRSRSLVLDNPVRSGQSIQHLDGDVTVFGSVASGAEVIAGGSVHVYGRLSGRAIAGAVGDANARIVCRRFEPELVAIDGLYKTADDLDPRMRGKSVQARLDGDTLVLAAID